MYCPACAAWHGSPRLDPSAESHWTWFQEEELREFIGSAHLAFKGAGKGGVGKGGAGKVGAGKGNTASSSETAPLALPAPPASTARLEAQVAELVERVRQLEARVGDLEDAQAPPPGGDVSRDMAWRGEDHWSP